ncbi:hypothetical protein OH492_04025 [Vibrio chagasii]|nr:hypothetical protein [Vibrio chagasii]
MPDRSTSYDYVLLNLAANQDYQFDTVSGWAIGAKKIAQNVIIYFKVPTLFWRTIDERSRCSMHH